MPLYQYTAMDATGKETKGFKDAPNEMAVAKFLKDQGMHPTGIKPATGAAAKKATGGGNEQKKSLLSMEINIGPLKIAGKDLTILTRQLAILLEAGLPLVRALRTLEKQAKNPAVRKILGKIAASVEGGAGFSEALAQFPTSFDNLYVNMVRAGEASGKLDLILNRLASFREKAAKIAGKVKSAMTYPIIVLVIAISMTAGLMVGVVPKFEKMFKGMLGENAQLPELTMLVVNISRTLQEHIVIVLVIVAVLIVGIHLAGKTAGGKLFLDTIKFKMPLIGSLVSKNSISKFARTLGTLTSSAVPALDALKIVRDTADNALIAKAVQQIHDAVKEGETMSSVLSTTNIFPVMVVSMIEVGEETAKTPEMLEKIADTYDDEVDNAVAALTSMIEPLLMMFLAVVVGGIVIAMFLPLIKIIETLSAG
ncbi:MAG: type II secretion system F family protein [Lentisphaeria bacterium]|nr:type II secretion system F family protein [Lentisphaeria bacterium]